MKIAPIWIMLTSIAFGSSACTPAPTAPASHDGFDWAVTKTLQSPDHSAVAILETGTGNNGADPVPLHRLTLQLARAPGEFGNHAVVWQSQVSPAPALSWSGLDRLVVAHKPHLVLEYEPEVILDGRPYSVDLAITRARL